MRGGGRCGRWWEVVGSGGKWWEVVGGGGTQYWYVHKASNEKLKWAPNEAKATACNKTTRPSFWVHAPCADIVSLMNNSTK